MLGELEPEDAVASVEVLKHLLDSPWPVRPYRKIEIRRFDSEPAAGCPIEDLLHSVGFEQEGNRLVLWSADR